MKTALRSFALCLLLSNSRGFADIDYTKLAVNAATLYATVWVAVRTLDVAEYVVDKLAGCSSTVKAITDNTITPALQLADIRTHVTDVKVPVLGLGGKK
jgi:hypothetical protein